MRPIHRVTATASRAAIAARPSISLSPVGRMSCHERVQFIGGDAGHVRDSGRIAEPQHRELLPPVQPSEETSGPPAEAAGVLIQNEGSRGSCHTTSIAACRSYR